MSLYCTSSNGRWRTRSRSIWEGNPRVTCPFLYLEISSTKILKKEPFTKMGYWHFFLAQNKTSDGYFVAQKKVLLLQPRSAAYSFLYLSVHQSMRQTDIRTREIKYKSSSNSVPTPTQCSIFSLKFNFNSLFQKKLTSIDYPIYNKIKVEMLNIWPIMLQFRQFHIGSFGNNVAP